MHAPPRRLVVVLGMHRSGTSAVARALRVMRVDLGEHLLAADEGINDKGYWEDSDLNQLNIDMFKELGTDWHHLAPLPHNYCETLISKGFLLRAVDLLRSKLDRSSVFGFKDPRVSLLLSFWKQAISSCPAIPSYLIAIRNPISVVRSLANRDNFDLEKSTLLWLMHMTSIVEGVREERNVEVVDYDQLLQEPETELRRIAHTLELPIDEGDMHEYTAGFLESRLRHSEYVPADLSLHPFTRKLANDLYSVLLEVACRRLQIGSDVLKQITAKARQELHDWEFPLSIIDGLYQYKRNSLREAIYQDSKIKELDEQLLRSKRNSERLFRETAERDLTIKRLKDEVAATLSQRQLLEEKAKQWQTKLELEQRGFLERARQVSELTRTVSEKNSLIATLQHVLDDQRKQIGELATDIEKYHRQARMSDEMVDSLRQRARNLEESLATKSHELQSLNEMSASLTMAINERQLIIVDHEQALAKLRDTIQKKDRLLENSQRYAAEGDLRIGELEATNKALNVQIAQVLESARSKMAAAKSREGDSDALRSILECDGSAFVRAAYLALLRREPDVRGHLFYWSRLRAGIPKLQILGELSRSDEARKAETRVAGLHSAVKKQRYARIPLVGRLMAKLMAVDDYSRVQTRLRAIQQQMSDDALHAERNLEHIAQEFQLIRRSIGRRKHFDAEVLKSIGAEHIEEVTASPAVKPSESERGRPASSTPVVFQIDYAATASPESIGLNNDTRELAAGFRRIRIRDDSSGAELCNIDFRAYGNARDFVLFGFSDNEEWGTWTVGKKSAFAVWLQQTTVGGFTIEIDAKPFQAAFSSLKCIITSSIGHRGEFDLTNDVRSIRVPRAEKPANSSEIFLGGEIRPDDGHNVSLVANAKPKISIIILNFNKPKLSLLSARSVLAAHLTLPYEVIVVDNGSTEANFVVLSENDLTIRIHRVPCNRYFGEGNNIGAEAARGEYLLFLNNDAFLSRGCVESLIHAFSVDEACGIAGPIFRYPDGRLQEAGAFIRSDGNAEQRGKFGPSLDTAKLPQFDVVDYVSAACLLIKKDRFIDLGGFNYRYDPAYYEDTDLCFRVLLRDEHVVLARDAICFHIENATTADKRSASGVVSTVDHNRKVFLSVWGKYLEERVPANLPRSLLPAAGRIRSKYEASERSCRFTQATYSPYPLVPGGGERFILGAASALLRLGQTAFLTPDPFSSLRLDNVMFDLGLPAGDICAQSLSEGNFEQLERIIVMGNEIYPSVHVPAERSFYHCQFPFPLSDGASINLEAGMKVLAKYEKVIVNSIFTKRAYERELSRIGSTAVIEVVYPPVATDRFLALAGRREPWILSVGRFSAAGHSKRQDVIIQALKQTSRSFRENWKLILCGTVPNNPIDRAYFKAMQESIGHQIQVEFILSPSPGELDSLFAKSSIYAHACGYDVHSADDFWKCEHFGITIVEAMVAGCQVVCYEIGGGPEIIGKVGAGTTFSSIDDLASKLELLAASESSLSTRRRAADLFGDAAFYENIRSVVS